MDTAQSISDAKRRAASAERETADRLDRGYLADRAEFAAHLGRVALGALLCGRRHRRRRFRAGYHHGDDYYRHHEDTHAMIGDRTGEAYRLGDQVRVRLIEAIPTAGALRFEMLSPGKRGEGPASKGKRAHRRLRGRHRQR